MTTPYVFLTAQKTNEPVETPQDTANTYFWGGVAALLLLAAVAVFLVYGLSTAAPSESGSMPTASLGLSAPVLTQLPLYLGSTQFSDPPENV